MSPLPEDWKVSSLSEVTILERGKFTHRPRNDIRYYGGKYPFIQTGDIAKSNGAIEGYTQTLNERGYSVSKLFPKGTIVISIAGNIGDAAILTFDSCFPDSVIGISPKKINSKFLLYYLQANKKRIQNAAPQGTQKNINLEILGEIKVVIPPVIEQQSISEVLSSIDDAIILVERERRAVERLKVGVMKKLLDEKDENVVVLGNHLQIISGFAFSSKRFNSEKKGLPLIRIRDLGKDEAKTYYNGPYEEEYLVENGDLLIGMDGEFNAHCWAGGKALLNQRVCKIIPNNAGLDKNYLYYVIQKPLKKIESQVGQTTVKHLSTKDFFKIKLPLPAIEEQKHIAEILSTLDKKLSIQGAQKQKLERVKQGLMNDLLTGKKRISQEGLK
jgi:type I restriction enzyme S subunit